jgi:hypothetical protein
MKRYGNIVFLISLLSFLLAGSLSTIGVIQSQERAHVSVALHGANQQSFSPYSQPQGTSFNIRHRSALQNEDVVVHCDLELTTPYLTISESSPGYYSRWSSYLSVMDGILPLQQALPPSTGFRAPPFSC